MVPASGLDHPRQDLPGAVERPGAVALEALVEPLGRDFQDAAHLESTGVVDEDLRVAELIAYPLERRGDRRGVRRVRRDWQRRTPVVFDALPYLCEALLPAGHQPHGEALTGEAPDDSGAEPRADAEDHRRPAVHGLLLRAADQAAPAGNSNSSSDSDLISML